jgi:UDP-GlcNAc:undecaprenyl-phosphate GlcNAc-1-phosphate transferase
MKSWYCTYLYFFVLSGVLSLIAVPIFGRIARKTGYMSTPHPDKHGKTPIPLLGGAAIFSVFFIVVIGHYLIALLQHKTGLLSSVLPNSVISYAPGVLKSSSKLLPLFAGGLIIFLLGLIDDKRDLSPALKLAGQFVAALVIVLAGTRLTLFIPNLFVTSFLTVIWIMFIVNAFNYLDNMDGLSAGIAFIASVFFLFSAVQIKMYFVSATLAVLAGTLIGFLRYNFSPAAIYMGDAGSMFIGYLLAALTIESTFYQHESSPTYFPVLMPLIVLAIPIYEMIMVVSVRLKKGLSVFKPSKDHLSYRIADVGLSVRGAVLLIYFLTICSGIAALLLPRADLLGSLLLLVQVIFILSIVAILIHYGKKEGPP